MNSRLIVIKIGGSVLNPKSSFDKINRDVAFRLGEEIARLRREHGYNFVIIHGGGGLAHTAVKVFRPLDQRGDIIAGTSLTKLYLLYLKFELCRILYQAGLPVYPLDTEALVQEGEDELKLDTERIFSIIDIGLVPVLNGDLEIRRRRGIIVSGDYLVYAICRDLRPLACIFLIDKKGVLDKEGRTIPSLKRTTAHSLSLYHEHDIDVTGGLRIKLEYSFKIAELGVKVYICSGYHPQSIREVLLDTCTKHCTMIEA